MHINKWILLGIFCVSLGITEAQNISTLKKRKGQIQKDIEYTNRLLKQTQKNSKSSLDKITLLSNQISLREEYINEMEQEILFLNSHIEDNSFVVTSLSNDLSKLKGDYAQMIRYAQKNHNQLSKIYFILSADNFSQSYHRFLYLKQYTEYRHKQVETILALKTVIDYNLKTLQKQKSEKELLMSAKLDESFNLKKEQQDYKSTLSDLKSKASQLNKELLKQKRISQQLEKEIEKLIAEEARKAKAGKGVNINTPEQKQLANSFEQNKGKLPWPVIKGVITDKFGEHMHPVIKNLKIKNSGIDISTTTGSDARAVFNGTVSKIIQIPGGNITIILRHGKYLTVYSNLKSVSVDLGQEVKTKQTLGKIYTSPSEKNTVLKFQIWKESQKMNPEYWITK